MAGVVTPLRAVLRGRRRTRTWCQRTATTGASRAPARAPPGAWSSAAPRTCPSWICKARNASGALACKGPLNARLATGVGLSFFLSRREMRVERRAPSAVHVQHLPLTAGSPARVALGPQAPLAMRLTATAPGSVPRLPCVVNAPQWASSPCSRARARRRTRWCAGPP